MMDERNELKNQIINELNLLLNQRNQIYSKIKELKLKWNCLPIGINQLSDKLLNLIFDYLPLADLLKCKKVCHNWNEIIENYKKPQKLLLYQSELDYKFLSEDWLFINELCDVNYSTIMNTSLMCNELIKNSFLSNLKYLKISNDSSNENELVNCEFINQLGKLEIVEIFKLKCIDKKFIITLPNLKLLSIKQLESGTKFNTPNLIKFHTDSNLDLVDFVFPETLKHLFVFDYHDSIGSFTNLEKLYCSRPNIQILSILPNLKELHLWHSSDLYESCDYEKSKTIFLELLSKKKNNMKLIFFGIVLKSETQLNEDTLEFNLKKEIKKEEENKKKRKKKKSEEEDQIVDSDDERDMEKEKSENNEKILTIQLKNYSNLIDDLKFVEEINYPKLIKQIQSISNDFQIPNDFFFKFNGIKKVRANELSDELLQFLKSCKNLITLSFDDVLTQQFSYKLPNYCPYLSDLICSGCDDLNFALNFKGLNYLSIRLGVPVGIPDLDKKEFVNKMFNKSSKSNFVFKYRQPSDIEDENTIILVKINQKKLKEYRVDLKFYSYLTEESRDFGFFSDFETLEKFIFNFEMSNYSY